MQMEIAQGTVHVWVTFSSDIVEERLLEGYLELLSVEERERRQRFHYERDRHRYLVTRALVRDVLSRYVPVRPQDWVFAANAYGRPNIVNEAGRAAGLRFNVSHTRGVILLGVTLHSMLGVDVESLQQQVAASEIAPQFFASQELVDLERLSEPYRQRRFFEYWTLKESYIKARGMGFSFPLEKVSFGFAVDQRITLSLDPQLKDQPSQWHFWQFELAASYLAAICLQCNARVQPEILIRKVVPLGEDSVLDPPSMRSSALGALVG